MSHVGERQPDDEAGNAEHAGRENDSGHAERAPRSRIYETVQRRLQAWVLAYGRFRRQWYALPLLLVVLFGFLLVLPFLLNVTVMGVPVGAALTVHTLVLTLIWATAAQAWNITSGYAGRFSLGHAAFFGLGAYVPILLIEQFALNPWLGMLVGGVVATLYGLVIGVLCFRFRVRGAYFVLATLAFAELLRYVFLNVSRLGGASGFVRPLPAEYAHDYGLLAFQFTSDLQYYYVILAFLAVVTGISFAIRYSRFGLYLLAVRENEQAARALGIPAVRLKLWAFGVSAFFTAWVGSFWGMYFSSIRPEVIFDLLVNIEILLPAIVGGLGTVLGPILGSLVVTPAAEVARRTSDLAGLDQVIYGVFLILIALYSPGGVRSWPGRLVDLLGLRAETGERDETES